MIHWVILGFLVVILFVLFVTLGHVVEVSGIVEKIVEKQENVCSECGAYKKMGRQGRFTDHAEWCRQNPRWQEGTA